MGSVLNPPAERICADYPLIEWKKSGLPTLWTEKDDERFGLEMHNEWGRVCDRFGPVIVTETEDEDGRFYQAFCLECKPNTIHKGYEVCTVSLLQSDMAWVYGQAQSHADRCHLDQKMTMIKSASKLDQYLCEQ